jgi:signal transduction histidine kinase/ligand-binding sensor domain-containing protein
MVDRFIFLFIVLQTGLISMNQGQTVKDLRFENISVNEGLSQSTGRVVIQDSKGFIWIGTQDGLNKYDGRSFTVYNSDPLDTNSMSDNFIQDITEDEEGILWIGYNTGGMDRFDPDYERFTHYKSRPGDTTSISNNNVNQIYIDREGTIWVGTVSGADIFDRKKGTFRHISLSGLNNPSPFTICFYEDRQNRFWIGTGGFGLIEYDRTSGKIVNQYQYDSSANSLTSNTISCVLEDSFGKFWIATSNRGLNRLDRETGHVDVFVADPDDPGTISDNNIFKIIETTHGENMLWVGTQNGGINRLNRATETFTSYQNDPNDPFSISNNIIFSMTASSDGTMWIGTGGGGINKFSLRKPKFQHYKYPGNVLGNFVWEIFDDRQGRVWIGSQGSGLFTFDRQSYTFKHYLFDPVDPALSKTYNVLSVVESKDGTLWIATSLNGLFRVNEKQGVCKNYRFDPQDNTGIASNNLRVVYESSDGSIWMGFNGAGLNRMDKDSEKFTRFTRDPSDSTSLSFNIVFSVYEDKEKAIWVGTYGGGLNRLDPSTGNFTAYVHDPNNQHSISNNRIRCIFEDLQGTLWVGTDHGLNKMDKETGRFKTYTTRDGLPNNVIYSILPDQHGNFWLATNHGLSRFNPADLSFRNYDEQDGLQSNEFNTGAFHLSESGEMFFGGINGFNIFHPDSIRENDFIPPVLITNFKLFNKTVKIVPGSPLKKNITETSEIILTHRQNFVSFEFAAFNYINAEKNQYKYMLAGVDPDWVEAGNRRFADYPGLQPGKYTFRVRGSNNDGTWNNEGDMIRLIIRPPWWSSIPAYIIYVLLLVISIIGYIRIRTYRLEQLRKTLENQVEERTREIARQKEEIESQRDSLQELNATRDRLFRIIAHDLKNPMTALMSITQSLTMGYHELEDTDREEAIGQVDKAAGDLLRLLDNLLQWTTSQTGGMPFKPERFDLSLAANESYSLAEPLARKKNISLDCSIPQGSWVKADRNMISSVFRNLLSNAIKFTPIGGKVTIELKHFSKEDAPDCYEVSVSDSGIGIPKDRLGKLFRMDNTLTTKGTANESGTGLGLLLCYDFVMRNHGTLRAESETGKGSRFIFTLPAIK